jgi:DNA-binding MarR family transcriptional regulator
MSTRRPMSGRIGPPQIKSPTAGWPDPGAIQDHVSRSPTEPTPEICIEVLTRALFNAGHRFSLIDESNARVGTASLEEAIDSGQAFFGRVRDDVLALDLDDPASAPTGGERLYWAARMMGLPALLLESGQRDRRHLFVWPVSTSDRVELVKAAKSEGADVRVDIRPPLAPHRWAGRGVAPRILRGGDVLSAFLTTGELGSRRWGERVRRATINEPGRYASTSELVAAASMAAVNAGWSFDDFQTLLESTGPSVAQKYQERARRRGAQQTAKWLRKGIWDTAVHKVARQPAKVQAPPPAVLRAIELADSIQWPPRAGSSQRAVYLALLARCERKHALKVKASYRSLMEEAGIASRSTIERALKGLEERGLITWATAPTDAPPEKRHRPTSWWKLNPVPDGHPRQAVGLLDAPPLDHDVFFNRSGLGKTVHRVLSALQQAPGSTVSQLAAGLSLDPRSITKHLNTMKQHGLSDHDEAGHWFPVDRDLNAVAADLGNAGRAADLRQQVRTERTGYEQANPTASADQDSKPA